MENIVAAEKQIRDVKNCGRCLPHILHQFLIHILAYQLTYIISTSV